MPNYISECPLPTLMGLAASDPLRTLIQACDAPLMLGKMINAALVYAVLLTGCSAEPRSSDEDWSASVTSPGRFSPHPDLVTLELPASRDELSAFLGATGAESYATGPNPQTYSPPSPMRPSPCQQTAEAIVFSYPIEEAFQPRYVAYVSQDEVVCIDRQFSYLAPGPF